MVRYTGPRNRIARRFGVNIFGRVRNPLVHKPNPPGVHGARRRKKSDFGVQLEEKQKLKALYGMLTEKQLVNTYKKALQKKGKTAEIFVSLLERRLETVVYRLKLAPTPFSAQQLISHGHIQVNGKKVDRRSFLVEPGMIVSVKDKSQKIKIVSESVGSAQRSVPDYLRLDKEKFSGQLLAEPLQEQIPWPIELKVADICDFLAHTT